MPDTKTTPARTTIRRSMPLIVALISLVAIGFGAGRWLRGTMADRPTEETPEGLGLTIVSEPPGASAIVNGRLVGPTPLEVAGLRPGAYVIRLEKAGHQPASRRVDLAASRRIAEKLSPIPTGKLVIDIVPEGSEVVLDGALIGLTPLTRDGIPVGKHVQRY